MVESLAEILILNLDEELMFKDKKRKKIMRWEIWERLWIMPQKKQTAWKKVDFYIWAHAVFRNYMGREV
jgi:hypothetical protein